jgi:predicted RNA-binding protein with RPS1 domain
MELWRRTFADSVRDVRSLSRAQAVVLFSRITVTQVKNLHRTVRITETIPMRIIGVERTGVDVV